MSGDLQSWLHGAVNPLLISIELDAFGSGTATTERYDDPQNFWRGSYDAQ